MSGGKSTGSCNIGIYVRESRDDNGENLETIETQRDLLVDYINKNDLGRIYRIYMDDNVSGSGFEREGIEALKKDIMESKINLLVVKDLSRLGRNNAKTLLFLDFLEEYGVRVITFDGRYDSLRDNDTVGIDTWYNERYIRDLSRKIRANLRFKIQKGEYIGHAPYGYQKSTERKNRLCVDEAQASVVREIYEWYLEGYGYEQIARKMNQKGYQAPSSKVIGHGKGGLWNAVAVQRILSNRVDVGDTVQGVSEKISFKSKKTRRLPRERWVITPDTHKAIVSREQYEEVQRIRQKKNQGSGSHKGILHPFRGLLFCGECGSSMFARVRKDRPMGYICSNYGKKGLKACTSHFIQEKELQEILMGEVLQLVETKGVKEQVAHFLEMESETQIQGANEVQRLELQVGQKQKQQDILYMDRLEGRISEEFFNRMNSNLERRIQQLREQLKGLKNRQNDTICTSRIFDGMLEWIRDNGLTREMAAGIIERITVFDDLAAPGKETVENGSEGRIVIDFTFQQQ